MKFLLLSPVKFIIVSDYYIYMGYNAVTAQCHKSTDACIFVLLRDKGPAYVSRSLSPCPLIFPNPMITEAYMTEASPPIATPENGSHCPTLICVNIETKSICHNYGPHDGYRCCRQLFCIGGREREGSEREEDRERLILSFFC